MIECVYGLPTMTGRSSAACDGPIEFAVAVFSPITQEQVGRDCICRAHVVDGVNEFLAQNGVATSQLVVVCPDCEKEFGEHATPCSWAIAP